MRENLDNKKIIINNLGGVTSIFPGPFTGLTQGFDSDINYNINIPEHTHFTYRPELRFSFLNQYIENGRWHFDLYISARLNWYFNRYDYNKPYDYNKLLWPDPSNLTAVFSGNMQSLGPLMDSNGDYVINRLSTNIFTAHGSHNNYYSNKEWPKNYLGDILNNNIANFSYYTWINSEHYYNYFNNYEAGIPIQNWVHICKLKNVWKFMTTSNIFTFQNGSIYYPFGLGNNLKIGYQRFDYRLPNVQPALSNTYYKWIVYAKNGGIGELREQSFINASCTAVANNNMWFKKVGNYYNRWDSDDCIYNFGENLNAYWDNHSTILRPYWQVNQYNIRFFLRNYDSNSLIESTVINYNDWVYPPSIEDLNVPEGYHFVRWRSLTENNRILETGDIISAPFANDYPHGMNYDILAEYEPNIYTVIYKNNIDSQDNYAVQKYDHREKIISPTLSPNKESEGLKFNGWCFNNGKKLVDGYYFCNQNYTFTAAWDGDFFNVNYTIQNTNKELNLKLKNITDSWNNQSQNLSKDRDICYLKQIAQPNLGYYSGVCWQDTETKQCYVPGQRINHSVNLIAIDPGLNNDEILALPLSIFDKEMIKNESITWCSFGRMTDTGYEFTFKSRYKTKIINSYELCYGDTFNNLISQPGSGYINSANYTVNNIIENSLNPLSPVKFYFVEKNNFGKKYGQMLPIPFKPGYIFNGWWYLNEKFTDNKGYCIVTNYKDYNFQGLSILNDSLIQVNNVFIPEFINLKNNQYYHFPFVLTNRNNNIEEVNFNDYSRLYTTKWLNENTTFNESYHFPALFVPYKE